MPTHRVCEAALLTFQDFLHIHRNLEHRWTTSDIDSVPCCCGTTSVSSSHLLSRLRLLHDVNANSTFFGAKSPYFEWAIAAFRQWLNHHGLRPELIEDFCRFLCQQWKQHLAQLESTPRLFLHLVQHLLRILPRDPVIHHGHHEQFCITILSKIVLSRCFEHLVWH